MVIYAIVGFVVAGISFHACKTMYGEIFMVRHIKSDILRFLVSGASVVVVIWAAKTVGIGTFPLFAFGAAIVGILILGLTIYRHKQNGDTVKANA